MAQNTISSWNFYKGWDIYQSHLVRAIEPLTAEQLELRISPNLRSIGLLAKHIVRTRANWLALAIGEGGPDKDVAAIAKWQHDGDIPSTAELVRGLEVRHVIEHDLHHGGELSFSLGAHGLAAPDL